MGFIEYNWFLPSFSRFYGVVTALKTFCDWVVRVFTGLYGVCLFVCFFVSKRVCETRRGTEPSGRSRGGLEDDADWSPLRLRKSPAYGRRPSVKNRIRFVFLHIFFSFPRITHRKGPQIK